MLISSRLFPATLPNRESNYCFLKFLYVKFYNSIYLTYISKYWSENLIYNSFFLISKWVALIQILNFFATKTTKMYLKYFNGKLWPYHLSCFVNSVLYDPACEYWLFEKFIFELEASYSFKIARILERQVRSLN